MSKGIVTPADNYESCFTNFRWPNDERFNIATAVCDRHALATPDATAVIYDHDSGTQRLSFVQLQRSANRLANTLSMLGIVRGDRIAIHLPQCPDTAIAHVAIYKLGAIAVPLFTLFGEEALQFRLANSGARVLITAATSTAPSSRPRVLTNPSSQPMSTGPPISKRAPP